MFRVLCLLICFFSLPAFSATDGAGGGDIEIIGNFPIDATKWVIDGQTMDAQEVLSDILQTAKETSVFLANLRDRDADLYNFLLDKLPNRIDKDNFPELYLQSFEQLKEFQLVNDLPNGSDAYFYTHTKKLAILAKSLGAFKEYPYLFRFLMFHEGLGLMGIAKEDALVINNPELVNDYPITQIFRVAYYRFWKEIFPASSEIKVIPSLEAFGVDNYKQCLKEQKARKEVSRSMGKSDFIADMGENYCDYEFTTRLHMVDFATASLQEIRSFHIRLLHAEPINIQTH
jgi:hypothetical protein